MMTDQVHVPLHYDKASPIDLLKQCPAYEVTPLVSLPALAAHLGVTSIFVKDESRRALGSFKSLGGVLASLRALARSAGVGVADLFVTMPLQQQLPTLICASDGNHGLAVASAARLVGADARIYLPCAVSAARVARIRLKGAEIVLVAGTYDDAVRAASRAADNGEGLLVADTTGELYDLIVADVMAGYGVMADEIAEQLGEPNLGKPTHLFVQAGVGGLAAALATRLKTVLAAPARIVIVEPLTAECVSAALAVGHAVPVSGTLDTVAEMLSCGEASVPALAVLQQVGANALGVSEGDLLAAPAILADCGGPITSPSGAAGLAGLRLALSEMALSTRLQIGTSSRILLIVTEAAVNDITDDQPVLLLHPLT
jgi:diaminopropionate ammonia-lyase